MEKFLVFLELHYRGVLYLVLILFSIILAINWLAVIFSWGKFKKSSQDLDNNNSIDNMLDGTFAHIVSRFLVNIIDDFKHLLALIIVIIFAILILYSMTATNNFDEKMEALQVVIASLGGLLGSIIGYYFGESAAKSTTAIQIQDGDSRSNDITPTPIPESLEETNTGASDTENG